MWRWLEPGLELKRWVVLIALAAVVFSLGIASLVHTMFPDYQWLVSDWYILVGLGLVGLALGVWGLVYSVVSRTNTGRRSLYQKLRESSRLRRGPRIVAIGGGTGLSTVLRGLKKLTSNLTAIVAVTDDGGSSGRLRKEFDVPAPGDLRNCLVALAPEEGRLSELVSYRFEEGEELRGHSVGNLLLTALTEINGGFPEAIRECSEVLAIQGRVLPSMLGSPQLRATMSDGSQCVGETSIAQSEHAIESLEIHPEPIKPNPEAIQAIREAELVVIGPGSLFTSIFTNLLEPKICRALSESEVPLVYICNLMTQPGETEHFSVSDHLRMFESIPPYPIHFDHVIVNTRSAPKDVQEDYESQGASQVVFDVDEARSFDAQFHTGDFLKVGRHLRHDVEAVCEELENILDRYNGYGVSSMNSH